jgi:2-hydroxychromene-2-carboxylate isomerase
MSKRVDFYFTPVSPWTYLGMPRFRAMIAKYGAGAVYKPVDLGPLFASAGVKVLKDRPEPLKRNRMNELRRWREFLAMPLNLEPKYFPVSAVPAARTIIAARQAGHAVDALSEALLRACWAEERNIGDEGVVAAIAAENGLDGAALTKAAATPEVQAEYDANTKEALERFIWGSPSFYVDGELFFGQDRLPFLERKLAG